MALAPNTHLGPYEILQPIGAGGMGQVYKARDTRLNRTVAIKVLPPEFASRPDWKQRFEREAQTTSFGDPHGVQNLACKEKEFTSVLRLCM